MGTIQRLGGLLVAILAFGLVLAGSPGDSLAAKKGMMKMPDPITVQGTLVDTKCYSMNAMNSGNDHKTPKGDVASCATACASMGIPVGVVDKKGNLHVILAPSAPFASHMSKTVRVTGMPAVDGHGIIASKAEVKDGNTWTEVSVTTMM